MNNIVDQSLHDTLTLVARVLYGVVVWAPGRIGCLCNGLYAVLSSGIVFRASYSKMKMLLILQNFNTCTVLVSKSQTDSVMYMYRYLDSCKI